MENTNRRALRWLLRKCEIRSMTDQDLKNICDRLNNILRKCLGWKTPAEVFLKKKLDEVARWPALIIARVAIQVSRTANRRE